MVVTEVRELWKIQDGLFLIESILGTLLLCHQIKVLWLGLLWIVVVWIEDLDNSLPDEVHLFHVTLVAYHCLSRRVQSTIHIDN